MRTEKIRINAKEFFCEDRIIVTEELKELFDLFGLRDVTVDIKSMNNANLIGTAIAALS